jgi:UDP-N-acetylglucosamine 1-carboxyvinyltransferase
MSAAGSGEFFRVTGGARLAGSVTIPGAKNSVLPLMAASLLAAGRTTLTGIPAISDVETMGAILAGLGCRISHDADAGSVTVDTPVRTEVEAPYELVRRIRGSICVLGPLLGRLGEARVPLPGGDAIGSRGVDMHVDGLQRLGAVVETEHGMLVARAGGLRGATILLEFPSVTGTENLVMAAVLAKGITVLDNAAREPEVADLCALLTAMGAHIEGAGTSTITIEGVEELHAVSHEIVPDRIVAGTFAFGAVMTQGDVLVKRGRADHLEVALDKLAAAGAVVETRADGFRVSMDGRPRAVDVATLPYPGFPTDLQPLAIALAAVSEGACIVTENLYEGRFQFVDELSRLGADVRTDGHHCVVHGRAELSAAPVRASDVRAGAGLVLAGLVAQGTTDVYEVHHVDRGYAGFLDQLAGLGATVERITG